MSQYTELQPERALDHEDPLAPGVPANIALDGVDADHVRTADRGTTTATSVSLTDTANADRLVEIFDGTTSKGIARVGADGTWSHTITVAPGARSITAKALEGTQPVSPAWRFTVLVPVELTPAITSVNTPQGAEIPNGGTTTAPSVTLTGTANANQQVEIFDGATSKGTFSVGGDGRWSATNITITVGAHSFTAKAKYGSEKSSPPRTLTRATALSIDTSYLTINGAHIKLVGDSLRGWVRIGDNPASMAQRRATGGIPPYSYTSSAPDVASVDSEGTVRSQRNGQARITVTDREGSSLSYTVGTTNNIDLYASAPTELFTYQEASDWIAGSPLNKRFPYQSDAVGQVLLADLINFRYPSGEISYHTGVLNPGSSDLINHFGITPTVATYFGPLHVDTRAAVMCYRDRN